jgi:membrane-bound lytic murein transglycosylase D
LYQRKQLHFRSLYKVYTKVKEYGYNPGIQELLYFQKGLRRQYLPGESQDYIRKIIALGLMNNREFVIGDHEHLLNRGVSDPIATVQVKGGLLLSDVAKVIGVSFDELHLINKQIKQGIISPHKDMEQIYIPYSRLSRFQTNIDNLKDSVYAMHKVKSGDSLYKIGKKYGIDYKLIKKFNKLKSNILSLNQHLIIPADPKLLPKQDEVYVIKKGDSLSLIAKKFNVDLTKLMKDNKITTSNIIVGDKLVISYE